MFYLRQGCVYLSRGDALVCPEGDIGKAISCLSTLNRNKIDEVEEDRYTVEGIDRYFQADPNAQQSREIWREDSLRNWEHLSGPELFQRYQRYAEIYCTGCREHDRDPTYEGFRHWLINARDMAGF